MVVPIYGETTISKETTIEKILDIEIVPSNSALAAATEAHALVIIHNNSENDLILNKIEVNVAGVEINKFSPNGIEEKITRFSSISIPITFTINEISSGSYPTSILITSTDGITSIGESTIVVSDSDSDLLSEKNLNNLLILLVIIVIPASFIERIIEVFYSHGKTENILKDSKKNSPSEIHTTFHEAKIISLNKIKEQIISNMYSSQKTVVDKLSNNYKDATETKPNDKSTKTVTNTINFDQTTTEQKTDIDSATYYSSKIKSIDLDIFKSQSIINHNKSHKAVKTWGLALGCSLISGLGFAVLNFGVLQILGQSGPWFILLDTAINALFIASGTKPIHDIIDQIKKLKT